MAAAATPSDTCGMTVPAVVTRMIPSMVAQPTVLVVAVAIAVLAAVLKDDCGDAGVAMAALLAFATHCWVITAVPPSANPNDPEVADIEDRLNTHSNSYVPSGSVMVPLVVALRSFCAAVCDVRVYAALIIWKPSITLTARLEADAVKYGTTPSYSHPPATGVVSTTPDVSNNG
jgi:hypothetical protein